MKLETLNRKTIKTTTVDIPFRELLPKRGGKFMCLNDLTSYTARYKIS